MELLWRLYRLSRVDKYPFHMPGHKNIFPQLFGCFDPTELPGLDNLHSPQDVLSRVQDRVADIYQVARTYFLVNGSSVGIMAAINCVLRPGDKILVPRSCHKSILAGLIHSGAMPVWLEQEYDSGLKHWLPPSKAQVEGLIGTNRIRAALFATPDYFGLVPDIRALVQICHQAGVIVIADEAHGAHLKFGPGLGLPLSAVSAQCDIIVQSPHKTLPALTQAAWLHLNNQGMSQALQESLNLFHTTSPSYLLLSSLDYAAGFAQVRGYALLRRLKLLAKMLELRSRQLNLAVFPKDSNRDWTKFTLAYRAGMEADLHRAGIFPELIQGGKILFMLTLADAINPAGVYALYRLLPCLAELVTEEDPQTVMLPPAPIQEYTPREAWLQTGQRVSVGKALGRISRQIIAPYPPGTMVIAPGQRLTSEHIDYLLELVARKVINNWVEVI